MRIEGLAMTLIREEKMGKKRSFTQFLLTVSAFFEIPSTFTVGSILPPFAKEGHAAILGFMLLRSSCHFENSLNGYLSFRYSSVCFHDILVL